MRERRRQPIQGNAAVGRAGQRIRSGLRRKQEALESGPVECQKGDIIRVGKVPCTATPWVLARLTGLRAEPEGEGQGQQQPLGWKRPVSERILGGQHC